MPRRAKPLSARRAETAPPGRHYDGDGLHLLVREDGSGFWVYRFTSGGRTREAGLGRARGRNAVTLAEARAKATKMRQQVRDGIDPLTERDATAAKQKAEAARTKASAITFRDVADRYLAGHETSWRSRKHRQQWAHTLKDYVFPTIGDLPIAEVGTGHVMQILEPLWREKTETAARLRGRIENILAYGTARGWRSGPNPAEWRNHLVNLLPARNKIARVQHHRAIDWREIGTFMAQLREQEGVAARCLEYAVLTAARSGEARGMVWGEVDLAEGVWRVPASRMKGGQSHNVPLSNTALAVLARVAETQTDDRPDALVFRGSRNGRPLTDGVLARAVAAAGSDATVHGMRSCFRSWCADHAVPPDVAESALAHVDTNKVQAAYQRSDLFTRRRALMDRWASFLDQPIRPADVVPLRQTVTGADEAAA
jgi:integrase